MPIYEYICLDCGERFEALRLMREADAPIACKKCESQRTLRQISVFFSQSAGNLRSTSASPASSGGCSGCSGGSCSSCGR